VTGEAPPPFEPLFLEGAAGRLFAIHHPPRGAFARAALYLPPFAEEMNRSRRVAALLARSLAEAGCGALLLDPYGTGDSEGDFAAARWETWREDARAGIAFLKARGYREVALVGLRLGALLALEAARGTEAVSQVVLWQPVLKGEQMLTQFLRLRLAAGLGAGKEGRETTADLRRRLQAGETLEIAGYALAPALAAAIDKLELGPLGVEAGAAIEWIAVEPEDAPPAPAQEKVAEEWRARGLIVRRHRVADEPFWSLQETTLAPALVARTTALLAGGAA
jgi:exosortase A-associated hydrolase 2